jgi:hypothetical protein
MRRCKISMFWATRARTGVRFAQFRVNRSRASQQYPPDRAVFGSGGRSVPLGKGVAPTASIDGRSRVQGRVAIRMSGSRGDAKQLNTQPEDTYVCS